VALAGLGKTNGRGVGCFVHGKTPSE
jgi:hypothetical protein